MALETLVPETDIRIHLQKLITARLDYWGNLNNLCKETLATVSRTENPFDKQRLVEHAAEIVSEISVVTKRNEEARAKFQENKLRRVV